MCLQSVYLRLSVMWSGREKESVCVVVTLQRVWCMRVFLLSVEGVEKHLFNLVYN